MLDFFSKLLDTSDFPARWSCGRWTSGHGWLHVLSDVAVFGAYLAIPCLLAFFLLKRRDLPFPKLLWLFGGFILACGTGHLIEATLFWQPWYRLSGLVKLVTAAISWVTVAALIPAIPKVLALPEMILAKGRLEQELDELRASEERLREQAEQLRRHAGDLEAFTESVVGREERVLELKREVDVLLTELGRAGRYSMAPA